MRPKLEYGARRPEVTELQAKLNLLLPELTPPLKLDGIYGAKGVARVIELQRRNGLVADGIVGAKTWAVVDGTAPAKGPAKTPATSHPKPAGSAKRVARGALLRCSFGAAPGRLTFADASRSSATITDVVPYANIQAFGMCTSLANPMVNAATAAGQGVLTPCPCNPVITGPWPPSVPLENLGKPPAPAIDTHATVVCAWGGLIEIH
ncbi:MAG: PAAR-like protein [Myxococcota bacterium]